MKMLIGTSIQSRRVGRHGTSLGGRLQRAPDAVSKFSGQRLLTQRTYSMGSGPVSQANEFNGPNWNASASRRTYLHRHIATNSSGRRRRRQRHTGCQTSSSWSFGMSIYSPQLYFYTSPAVGTEIIRLPRSWDGGFSKQAGESLAGGGTAEQQLYYRRLEVRLEDLPGGIHQGTLPIDPMADLA